MDKNGLLTKMDGRGELYNNNPVNVAIDGINNLSIQDVEKDLLTSLKKHYCTRML